MIKIAYRKPLNSLHCWWIQKHLSVRISLGKPLKRVIGLIFIMKTQPSVSIAYILFHFPLVTFLEELYVQFLSTRLIFFICKALPPLYQATEFCMPWVCNNDNQSIQFHLCANLYFLRIVYLLEKYETYITICYFTRHISTQISQCVECVKKIPARRG